MAKRKKLTESELAARFMRATRSELKKIFSNGIPITFVEIYRSQCIDLAKEVFRSTPSLSDWPDKKTHKPGGYLLDFLKNGPGL